MDSMDINGKKRLGRPSNNVPSRSKTPKNKTSEELALMKKVYEWVAEAVTRERFGEQVFSSRDKNAITASICGVNRSTVQRACKGKKEKRTRSTTVHFDDFSKKALSRLILGFYKRNPPVIPTLNIIHSEAMDIPDFPQCGRSTLRKVMLKIGFVCRNRSGKMNVYSRLDVVANRHRYLRAIRQYRDEGYEIFYQDESYCNTNHTVGEIWQLTDTSDCSQDNLIDGTK